jgi:uncharacterized protein (DUF58 family)
MSSSQGARDGGDRQTDTLVTVDAGPYALRFLRFVRTRGRRPPDETLLERRPLYVAALALAGLSFVVHQPLLFVAGLLVFIVAAVPEIWYRFGMDGLVIERSLTATRANPGDVVEVRLLVENRKPLPLPWLEIEDSYPGALHSLDQAPDSSALPRRVPHTRTVALWTYQRLRHRHWVRATARGVYYFGPLKVRATDPFGMLTREQTLQAFAHLVVHPLVVPVERFGLTPYSPFGERKSAQRLLEDPLRVAGIRSYMQGDEPRRIHWKATARTGTLQSKVYEPSTRHTLAIFLEIRTYPRMLMGYDEDLFELLACAAASVANWSLEQGYATGVYSNGTMAYTWEDASDYTGERQDQPTTSEQRQRELEREVQGGSRRLRLVASARSEQLIRILDGLAQVLPYYGLPMDQIILAEQRRLPMGATAVYIGTEAAVDVSLIVALRQLKAHGHTVSLLLARSEHFVGDHTVGALHLSGLPTHYIGGREDWQAIQADALGNLVRPTTTATATAAAHDEHAAAGDTGPQAATSDEGGVKAHDDRRQPRAIVVN